ncbi:MAG: hypothetical protein VKL42_08975 [Snowella sp.]|nr:hypothetical protein [Snowella sp.]
MPDSTVTTPPVIDSGLQYLTRYVMTNDHGYAIIRPTQKYKHIALSYINSYKVDLIKDVIDFPPSFRDDLGKLENKHFYSPNNDAYYFWTGQADDVVDCVYLMNSYVLARKIMMSDQKYLRIKETTKWQHHELMYIKEFPKLSFLNLPIYQKTKLVTPDLLPDDAPEPPPIPDLPPPPVPPKKFQVGPWSFDIPQVVVDTILYPIVGLPEAFSDAMNNEANQKALEEYDLKYRQWLQSLRKYDTNIFIPPSSIPSSMGSFFCPANNTFYMDCEFEDKKRHELTVYYRKWDL